MRMDEWSETKDNGLSRVFEISESGLSYEFHDMCMFLHRESGQLFWAETSGCSCPCPYEEYHFNNPNDTNMDRITKASETAFFSAIDAFPASLREKMEASALAREAIRKSSGV